uniref:Uncharacterized protein n=1 Tax=Drosophila melanogaster TaxID=7227 RepID=Q9VIL6_DROME|nr:uncharacterized protein Dmel_CG15475 [Drosophila melanogaster]AAF53901.1 uncharacterized protein Dmel_CG15475 [Drosophila melanogaster]|eukprot:NP_610039.1 uncharacterized protein Dmel_CG15475 [Drosophila melanogaster]
MAHNSTLQRKTKLTRLENPLVAPTYQQQGNGCGLAKEKVPKMNAKRFTRPSKTQAAEPAPKDTIHDNAKICNHFDLCRASKNPIRAAGGGNTQVVSKYQSAVSVSNQPVRSTVPRATHPKLAPKEVREARELIFKDLKEARAAKEPKDFRHVKETKDQQDPKEPKEPKVPKEPKDLKASGARQNINRTKNYFDKYLKFAFDLSTPDGIQKLEDHFFPNQDPTAPGVSNSNREK